MKTKANKKQKKTKKSINSEQSLYKKYSKVLLVSFFAGLALVGVFQINFDLILPIKKIRAQGEFANVSEKMILNAIANDVKGGYLWIDVHNLQDKIEKLAWVKIATVKRVWPDSIVVKITEQKAYAVWKNKGLLNELGEKFEPIEVSKNDLPILSGPVDLNVKVMNEYKKFEAQLNEIGLSIHEINLDDRRAVYLQLSNEIKISLGRSKYQKRLNRFITAYKINLFKHSNKIDYVDMRYTNGFSIKWKEDTQAAQAENVVRGSLDV